MKMDFDWNGIPQGIAVCRAEAAGNEQVRYVIERYNEEFALVVWGQKDYELLENKAVDELIAQKDRERFLQFVKDIRECPGKPQAIECKSQKSESETKTLYWRGKLLADGGDEKVMLTVADMTSFIREREMLLEAVHENQAHAQRVEDMIKQMAVGTAIFAEQKGFHLVEANAEFLRIAGYSKRELMEKQVDLFELIHPLDRKILRDAIEESRIKGMSKDVEMRVQYNSGEICYVVLQSRYFRKIDESSYFNIACWDITDRKMMENELYLLNEQYALLKELSNEILMDYDVEKKQYKISPEFIRSVDSRAPHYMSQEQALSQIHPEDVKRYEAAFEMAEKQETQGSIEFRMFFKKDPDSWRWQRSIYKSIPGKDGRIVRIIGKTVDITDDKEKQQELSEEARLDQQTRLLNKVETQRLVDAYLAENRPGTHVLFIIDIDHFKQINDTFGHTVGDTLIVDMSHKIHDFFRNSDIVGRIGGDEFVVFMKGTTESYAKKKAEQLCKSAKKVIYGGAEKLQVTVSIGGAIFGKDGNTYAELFDSADEAMYMVKAAGKNGFRFRFNEEERVETGDAQREKPNAIVTSGEHVDKELLSLAFNLLSHARDVELSLSLLLEQIGKYLQLDVVSVFMPDSKKEIMSVLHTWTNRGKSFDRDIVPQIWHLFEKETVGVFVEREGTEQVPIPRIGAVKFVCSNGVIGELAVASMKEEVQWSEKEKETLYELSRIVGVFVTLINRANEDKELIHEMRQRERLTGLYERDTFQKKVQTLMKMKTPGYSYALAVMDINNFSYVNENFGTEIGDKILRDLADLLMNSNARTKISTRMYSDYFATFISGSTKENVLETVKSGIRLFEERLNEKYPLGGTTLSVGICFMETPDEYEVVLENANIARKYAKEHGILHGIVYDIHMRQKRDELVEVSAKFSDALEAAEFEVYLQPKFLLKKWKVYGAEALVRWHQADGSIQSPGRFIPALEMTGQIVELDFYVFEKVVAMIRKWLDEGKEPLTVSTNFSRRHFEFGNTDFMKRIQRILDFYRVSAEYLEIEITESVVVDNFTTLKKDMEELKKMGFRIAIDDFGTGYSSLNVLMEIPADVIKMDKSFTDKLHLEKQRRFVTKLGLLIKAARQEVLFEGIETEEQLKFLKTSGFEHGQGYLFDKPMKIEAFEQKYL